MIAEIIILCLALLFLIMSIFLFKGKGKWLIAGYNTATEEERNKYDTKKLCRAVGFVCLICSILLCVMAYMGYKVDSGQINEKEMLPFGLIFFAIISVSSVTAIIYINTRAKNK